MPKQAITYALICHMTPRTPQCSPFSHETLSFPSKPTQIASCFLSPEPIGLSLMDYSYLKEHSHYATLEQSVKEGNYALTSLSFTY